MTKTSRTFSLRILPDMDGDYSVALNETSNESTRTVATLDGQLLERLRPAVMMAVTTSKQPRTALSASRRKPIPLTEDAGVRLGLTALAVKPLAKPARVEAVRQGVETMTSEEALYWYANSTGPNTNRALKALRTLLADE